jgi:glycosyltransferase involved in cell wall biosynthesis
LWSGSTLYEDTFLRRLLKPLIRLIIRNSDAFIVYGTRAKEYIESYGINSEKISIAINVGNVDFFQLEHQKLSGHKDQLKKKLHITNKKIILYVGRLIEIKGLIYLINAFNNLKAKNMDVGLVIVGDGLLKSELLLKYGHIKDIYFIGHKQEKDIPIYYQIADVFVLPSYYEIFSIAISEAMASKLPIITTENVGASSDLIKNNFNGYIVPIKNSKAIYDSLMKVILDDGRQREMGEASQYLIKNNFNLDKTVDGFINAIKYVLK